MNLSEPKATTFWIAVVLAVVGVLGYLAVAAIAPYSFWILLVGFVVLALGNLLSGF